MDEFSEFGQSGPSACGVAAYQRVAEFYEVFEGQLFGRLGEQRLGGGARSPCTSMVAPEASVLGHTRGMMSFARVRRVVLNVTVAAGRFFVDLKHDRSQNSQIRELFWRKMTVSGFVSASFESVSHGFELSTLRFGASKSVQNLSRVRSTFGNRMGAESVVRIRHRRKALCGAVRMSWAAAAKAHETYGG